MKKLALFLLAASCLLMCACSGLPSAVQTPAPAGTAAPSAAPAPTPSPHVTATPQPTPKATATPEDDPFSWVSEEFIADQIAAAEACRVQTQDTEYYLDTSRPIEIYAPGELEFPLYRKDLESGWADYLGTTGFAFQLFGNYIYIQSDMLQEDYPSGEITRVVDLETGAITPFKRNVDIHVPNSGDHVFYTVSGVSSIYCAEPSLKIQTEFVIRIPEEAEIEQRNGDRDNYYWHAAITDVVEGWITFCYYVGEYEGGLVYEGNYRIRTDGTGLEKTDAGQFYEE